MLARFDMPSSGQPQLSVLVIHEQQMIVIDQYEVRNEMLRRCCGFLNPAQPHAGIDPSQNVCTVRVLERVERFYRFHLLADGATHVLCGLYRGALPASGSSIRGLGGFSQQLQLASRILYACDVLERRT